MELELSDLLHRKADLNTPGFLSDYFRDEVLREAQVLYVAAYQPLTDTSTTRP
jgi:hypothetical protein